MLEMLKMHISIFRWAPPLYEPLSVCLSRTPGHWDIMTLGYQDTGTPGQWHTRTTDNGWGAGVGAHLPQPCCDF